MPRRWCSPNGVMEIVRNAGGRHAQSLVLIGRLMLIEPAEAVPSGLFDRVVALDDLMVAAIAREHEIYDATVARTGSSNTERTALAAFVSGSV